MIVGGHGEVVFKSMIANRKRNAEFFYCSTVSLYQYKLVKYQSKQQHEIDLFCGEEKNLSTLSYNDG